MLRKDILEVISYIMWSTSIGYLSIFQTLNISGITMEYQVAVWCYMLSAFLFYKDSYKEVTKEIIKSSVILVSTNILQMHFVDSFDIRNLIDLFCVQIVYQLLAYVFVWFIKNSKKLHGKYTLILETLFMIFMGFALFVLKLGVGWSIACSLVLEFVIGFYFYQRNMREK